MTINEIEEVVALNLSRDCLLVSLAEAGDALATMEVLRRMEIRAAVLELDGSHTALRAAYSGGTSVA